MRGIVVLMASMALSLLLASGVALAINEIRCRGGECKGTPRNDRMLGTDRRDIIWSFKGNDRIRGLGGGDDLYGFEGSDIAYGGDGSDKLGGSDGRDSLHGGGGSDSLYGGNGVDTFDYIELNRGNDKMYGGPDDSRDLFMVLSGGGTDLLDGGKGDDVYDFEVSFSHLGSGWHATISDSDVDPAPGQEVSHGDFLRFEIWKRDLTINLSPGPGPEVTDNSGKSTIQWPARGEFYFVFGGEGDDVITGDQWANKILGSEGSDTIKGRGGDDDLYSSGSGCCGIDELGGTIDGGTGNDLIIVESHDPGSGITSQANGGAGDDEIRARNGSPDTIDCGEGTDTVTSDAGMDTFTNCEP